MAFIRIKKFKKKNGNILEYAYLVQNKWRKAKGKTPKQKVKAYLGRVYRLTKEKELTFWETVDSEPEKYLKFATKQKIVDDLIRFELMKYGFVNSEGRWAKDKIEVDPAKKKIVNEAKSECVLKINEGNLCSYRIKKILSYSADGPIEETGLELARLFIESGIDIPQDVFIAFYEKT